MLEPQCYDVELPGCTPEPLMAYLKALGVLRLVSEQPDSGARGWWKNDVFCLRSKVLFQGKNSDDEKRNKLIEFFLREYQPTPLVAPWNAGSGFYLKWDEKEAGFKEREASKAVSDIESSAAIRFQPYRDQIAAVKKALKDRGEMVNPAKQITEVRNRAKREGWSKRKIDSEIKRLLDGQMLFSAHGSTFAIGKVDKDQLVRDTRSSLLNDAAVRWIDAAFVIRTGQKKNRTEAPLLGSGGNIGNSDFSARFMQILASRLPLNDDVGPCDESVALLQGALFGDPTAGLATLAVDQFDPGRAGGANMHQGMEAGFRLNPWDYILMLEGAVALQGASSKRLGAGVSASAFPFAAESTPAGFASSGSDKTRGEQWLPLWHRPCTASEIEALLAEGRSDVGSRHARTGVDFARAAASLGVDRGIKQFVRVQYQARFGDNYFANTLGRVDVLVRESVDLLQEIDGWLNRFRSACSAKYAPPRFSSLLRTIDSAIFDYCKYGGGSFFQRVLTRLGRAEHELANAERFRDSQKLRPVAGLSCDWRDAANDSSPEFMLALGLASVYDPEGKVGPLRANLEAVDWAKNCRAWAEKDRAVVWNSADLPTNLANALERRAMDGERNGCKRLPLASRFDVPLDILAAFIDGALDDERIENLIWGLMLVDSNRRDGEESIRPTKLVSPPPLPRDYALLKLLFLPRPLVAERAGGEVQWRLARTGEAGITIRPEPRILPLLRGGRVGEACRIAAQRLRVSGLPPMPGPVHGRLRDDAWSECGSDVRRARRLAAALLIPITSRSVNPLARLVCRQQSAAAEALAISAEGESE